MIRVAIYDECNVIRERFCGFLTSFSIREDIDCKCMEFKDSEKLFKEMWSFDVLFLDSLQKNEFDKINIAKHLRELGCKAIIIISLFFTDLLREGYKTNAYWFVEKPINKVDMSRILLVAIGELRANQSKIEIKCIGESLFFNPNDIIFIESYQRKRKIYSSFGEFESILTLDNIYNLLPHKQFCLARRSYIVNFFHVIKTTSNRVTLDNNVEIQLSRYLAKSFNFNLKDFAGGKTWRSFKL